MTGDCKHDPIDLTLTERDIQTVELGTLLPDTVELEPEPEIFGGNWWGVDPPEGFPDEGDVALQYWQDVAYELRRRLRESWYKEAMCGRCGFIGDDRYYICDTCFEELEAKENVSAF